MFIAYIFHCLCGQAGANYRNETQKREWELDELGLLVTALQKAQSQLRHCWGWQVVRAVFWDGGADEALARPISSDLASLT